MNVRFIKLKRPFAEGLCHCKVGVPFVCILFEDEPSMTKDEIGEVSAWIAASEARWAVCGGPRSDLWDDLIDWAFLELHDYQDVEPVLMTTFHLDESIQDVLEFGIYSTRFDGEHYTEFIVLLVGKYADNEAEIIRVFDKVRKNGGILEEEDP